MSLDWPRKFRSLGWAKVCLPKLQNKAADLVPHSFFAPAQVRPAKLLNGRCRRPLQPDAEVGLQLPAKIILIAYRNLLLSPQAGNCQLSIR